MRLLCYHYTRKASLATFVIIKIYKKIQNFAIARPMHSLASLSRFYGQKYEVASPVHFP
jgi:hypothetical protein